MKLRTNPELITVALLSALGASPLSACGGSARIDGTSSGAVNAGGAAATAGGAAGTGHSGSAGVDNDPGGAPNAAGVGGGGAGMGGDGEGGGPINRFPCTNPADFDNGTIYCDGFDHHAGSRVCAAGCRTDSDCGVHGACVCEGAAPMTTGLCVAADCASDSACQPGFLCRSYFQSGCMHGGVRYTCQSPLDECGPDTDCEPGSQCRFDDVVQYFRCIASPACGTGRPFLVEGTQRLAPATARADWQHTEPLTSRAELDLDPALRARLARAWTHVALLEHASIAAFGRFTLQLLSLGAPAELIEGATAAIADETRHATTCFALASGYAGTAVGPGPLAVEGSLDATSLQSIVLDTIREGCIGETLAAVEAREAAEHARTPELQRILATISEDETRHAALAFRFVQWALATGSASLKAAIRAEFAALGREVWDTLTPPGPFDQALLEHGIVPDSLRQAIRRVTIRDVILPCAEALQRDRPARFARAEPSHTLP